MKRMHPMLVAAGCLTFILAGQAAAQENFYAGKTINIIVGAAPGGGFDLYARALATHMPKYIPGSPAIVVQNMGGSNGTLRAANQVYSSAPKDGTTIAHHHASAVSHQLLGGDNATYDPLKFAWLGRVTYTNHSRIAWAASGIKTIEDAKQKEVIVGTSGLASSPYIYPALANALVGTKFKFVPGYQGSNTLNLALESGEIDAHAAAPIDGVFTQNRDWIDNGKINFLVQLGDKRDSRIPDVPTMRELAKTEDGKKLLDIITTQIEIGNSFWLSPEVPADRLATLREAFRKTMDDPAFQDNMVKVGAPARYEAPEAIAARVAAIAAMPAGIKQQAADLMLPK